MMKSLESEYGGDLQKRRAGRSHGRPLSIRHSMHLTLRSTKATGERSFLRGPNKKTVRSIIEKFAHKFLVKILSMANVGNHIHLHIKLLNRFTYFPFIRAVTGGIALAILRSGARSSAADGSAITSDPSNLSARALNSSVRTSKAKIKFWDRRPYTRIVSCLADFRNVVKYVRINELESFGFSRSDARQMADVEFSSG